jgi:hypothetical protein
LVREEARDFHRQQQAAVQAETENPVSVQNEFTADVANVERTQDPAFRDANRMQAAFDLLLPKAQELAEHRKFRRDVELLPDEGLKKAGMIRHVIENLRRGEAVALKETIHFPHVLHSRVKNRRTRQATQPSTWTKTRNSSLRFIHEEMLSRLQKSVERTAPVNSRSRTAKASLRCSVETGLLALEYCECQR